MRDCVKCIHYDVCINHNECSYFNDYEKTVILPCNIGDRLYAINGKDEIRSWNVICVRATKSRLNFNPEHIEYVIGCEKPRGILWIELDKVKNIYFSYEDAEKALERRKGRDKQ